MCKCMAMPNVIKKGKNDNSRDRYGEQKNKQEKENIVREDRKTLGHTRLYRRRTKQHIDSRDERVVSSNDKSREVFINESSLVSRIV